MSASYVRNLALRLARAELGPGPALDDVTATLVAADQKFSAFYYDLGVDAGWGDDVAARRAATALLQFASVQLADDLADGECTYLRDAGRIGPGCAWVLHHLYAVSARAAGVSAEAFELAARDFAGVGAAQQVEVRTERWEFSAVRAAAIGLNALQHRAYFRLVLSGSRLQDCGPQWGWQFGFALHVCGDLVKGDRRCRDLDSAARRDLATEVLQAVEKLAASAVPSLVNQSEWFRAVLSLL